MKLAKTRQNLKLAKIRKNFDETCKNTSKPETCKNFDETCKMRSNIKHLLPDSPKMCQIFIFWTISTYKLI